MMVHHSTLSGVKSFLKKVEVKEVKKTQKGESKNSENIEGLEKKINQIVQDQENFDRMA